MFNKINEMKNFINKSTLYMIFIIIYSLLVIIFNNLSMNKVPIYITILYEVSCAGYILTKNYKNE